MKREREKSNNMREIFFPRREVLGGGEERGKRKEESNALFINSAETRM
jgi:hypothetical protein